MQNTLAISLSAVALAAIACVPLLAQEATVNADPDALAKALSNPVASLISLPLQLNYDTGHGPADNGERWTLNVQPVIPVSLSQDWNLISRTIVPIITQSDVLPGETDSGLGDVVQSLFFSPKAPSSGGWIWGVGPAFLLPTATNDRLGAEQWALGPTGVALKQTASGWTYGALANHLWSVAGKAERTDVCATFLQPFLAKGLGKGASATVNFESTYDWKTRNWTLPLNLTYSKVTRFGKQLVSLAGGVRAYLDKSEGGPDWGLRAQLTFLFPR